VILPLAIGRSVATGQVELGSCGTTLRQALNIFIADVIAKDDEARSTSALGYNEKNSRRAYLVCIASITGISMCGRAGRVRARNGPCQKSTGLSDSCVSGQYRNSPHQFVGGCAGRPKKNRSISREASGPC
jgi:hypothetical protein